MQMPSLDNFNICNVLSPIYASIIGITEDEVNCLIDDVFVQSPHLELQKRKLKEWYGGYRVGNTNIFNSFSIMKCLRSMKDQESNSVVSYLTRTRSTKKIRSKIESISYSKALEKLFAKGSATLYDIYSKPPVDNENHRKELDIVNLLVFTGYLTRGESKNTYVMPNIEVKMDFHRQFFFSWIKAVLNLQKESEADDIITRLAVNQANLAQYLNIIQEEILAKLTQAQITKINFQNLIGGIDYLNISSSTHTNYSEMSNQYSKRLNFIFKPMHGKSDTYIIHKYRKIYSEIGVEDAMENAIWQIYTEEYISFILNEISPRDEIYIETRVFVFYRNKLDSWLVKVLGFLHNFKQAKEVDAIFSSVNSGLCKITNILSAENGRVKFLRPHKVSHVYGLLSKYSMQEVREPKDKKYKIRKLRGHHNDSGYQTRRK